MTALPMQPDPWPTPVSADEAHSTPGRGHLLPVPDLGGFTELRIWAECYEDAQKARIACTNRMERGGVPPEVFGAQIDALKDAEHQMKLALGRCYRRVVPAGIREWQDGTFGIGAHLLARLLGSLGHPRIATPYHWEGEGAARTLVADEVFERTVRQLWTYCGHGAALKRRKGMTAEEAFGLGSPRCKMLVHLLAEASIKCRVDPVEQASSVQASVDPTTSPHPPIDGTPAKEPPPGGDPSPDEPSADSPPITAAARRDPSADRSIQHSVATTAAADRRYRHTYEARRAHTATTNPDWTPGHSHNDALRIVGKRILADLWESAR